MDENTDKVDHEEKLVYKEMSTWNLVSVFFDNTSGRASNMIQSRSSFAKKQAGLK